MIKIDRSSDCLLQSCVILRLLSQFFFMGEQNITIRSVTARVLGLYPNFIDFTGLYWHFMFAFYSSDPLCSQVFPIAKLSRYQEPDRLQQYVAFASQVETAKGDKISLFHFIEIYTDYVSNEMKTQDPLN